MNTNIFDISGMTCGGCTARVEHALSRMDGVSQAGVTLRPAVATVVSDESRVTPTQIESVIAELGFPAKMRFADRADSLRDASTKGIEPTMSKFNV